MKTFRLACLLVLVLILSVAPTIGLYFKQSNTTKEALFGEQADEQMVLVVWNVDTFDGGAESKSAVLEKIGKEFDRKNKGLYVLVKNLSVEQFAEKILTEKPDVISFGSGAYGLVKNYSAGGVAGVNVFENVASSVTENDEVLATPWAVGCYFVFATEESLTRANAETENLVANCMNFDYKKTVGRKTKDVFSLALGTDALHSAKEALAKEVEFKEGGVDPLWNTKSYYDAYVQFVLGNSTFLLGTHRDVFRLENKQTQGAISELYAQMLKNTDLVQYAVVVNGIDEARVKYAKKFCEFLQTDFAQNLVFASGMLPVIEISDKTADGILKPDLIKKLVIKKLY